MEKTIGDVIMVNDSPKDYPNYFLKYILTIVD